MEYKNNPALLDAVEAMKRGVDEVAGLVEGIKERLAGMSITATLGEHLKNFDNCLIRFEVAYESSDDFDQLTSTANHVRIYATAGAQAITHEPGDTELERLKNALSTAASTLNATIADRKIIFHPNTSDNIEQPADDATKKINVLERRNTALSAENEAHKKTLAANERRLEALEARLETASSQVAEKLGEINALYDTTSVELKKKEVEIANLVGVVAGNSMSGHYEKCAEDERDSATYLRWASLFCMGGMFCIAALVNYGLNAENLKWDQTIFRVILAIFLSIPAAYLARESSKHRLQQYAYQQTSLDLKAITPYIASLPAAEQHKLKAEIAHRLFAPKNTDIVGKDSYPINLHEILIELIKKLEFPSKKGRDSDTKN